MKVSKCPTTGLMLPTSLIDEKTSLKASINKVVEQAVNSVDLKEDYFLILHAKFDKYDPTTFVISQLVASIKLPPFISNSMVFWVSRIKGIVELLWMVPAKINGKLQVEFNKQGVAYLQAKGAMPS
tara:strand:+ start:2264 stop:2641 length:378 start_codon:yes stop_codon:yes gene_type:complete